MAVVMVASVVMVAGVMVMLGAGAVACRAEARMSCTACVGAAGAGKARATSSARATGDGSRVRSVEAVRVSQGADDNIRAGRDRRTRRNCALDTGDLGNKDGRKETFDKHSC